MDFMDISKMRITVREFDPKPVEQGKIEKILEAGRWSPTAVNAQPQRVLVLNTPENLNKMRELCTFGYDKKYADLAQKCDDKSTATMFTITEPPSSSLSAMTGRTAGITPRAGRAAVPLTPPLWPPT